MLPESNNAVELTKVRLLNLNPSELQYPDRPERPESSSLERGAMLYGQVCLNDLTINKTLEMGH